MLETNWQQEEISAFVESVGDKVDFIKGKCSSFFTSNIKAQLQTCVGGVFVIIFGIDVKEIYVLL